MLNFLFRLPARLFLIGYITLIVVGSFLLMFPIATKGDVKLRPIDAIFTAASAVSVTGLVVHETATYFSEFGQMIILFLIQVGGLGIMTATTIFALLANRKIGHMNRILLQEEQGQVTVNGVVRITKHIIILTLALETVGALLIALYLYPKIGFDSIYFGFFHSISALMNAGFDITGASSFATYANDPVMNGIIMILIIIGGIGYVVLLELWFKGFQVKAYSVHTKLVLITTCGLICLGTAFFYYSEKSNPHTLQGLPLGSSVLVSTFQSINTRTAGFSSISLQNLHAGTTIVLIILMFIGASPGSTGGGIKTTTFAVLLLSLYSFLRGKEEVEVMKRRISQSLVMKAFALTMSMTLFVISMTLLLMYFEPIRPLQLLFETVSAFSTVGTSTGITQYLTDPSKLILTVSMIIGRLGPLTFLSVIVLKKRRQFIRLPISTISIG